MKYTEALAKLCGVMQEATDIKEIKFSKNRDSFRILFTSRAVDTFYAKEFENTEEKGNSNYTDYFTAIYEVMKGRPDIKDVKFSEDRESFEVISNTCNHICFANEFKKINENKWEEFPIKENPEERKDYTASLKMYEIMFDNRSISRISFSEDRKTFTIYFKDFRGDTYDVSDIDLSTDDSLKIRFGINWFHTLKKILSVMKERPDISDIRFSDDATNFEFTAGEKSYLCYPDEIIKSKYSNEEKKEYSVEEKQKLIDYIQLEAFRKIRQKANDITGDSSIEEFAGYVYGVIDLETELYSYIENNFKN